MTANMSAKSSLASSRRRKDLQIQGGLPWPREESNLRARIRSPSLYPLSYGAVRSSVAAASAKSNRPSRAAEAGFARLRRNRSTKQRYRRKSCAAGATFDGEVADGTRTHDHLDHNQGLYQLSYSHRAQRRIAAIRPPLSFPRR